MAETTTGETEKRARPEYAEANLDTKTDEGLLPQRGNKMKYFCIMCGHRQSTGPNCKVCETDGNLNTMAEIPTRILIDIQHVIDAGGGDHEIREALNDMADEINSALSKEYEVGVYHLDTKDFLMFTVREEAE